MGRLRAPGDAYHQPEQGLLSERVSRREPARPQVCKEHGLVSWAQWLMRRWRQSGTPSNLHELPPGFDGSRLRDLWLSRLMVLALPARLRCDELGLFADIV